MKALVPEDWPRIRRAHEASQRRSLMRAISSMALGVLHRIGAERVIGNTWPEDHLADALVKSAIWPTTTETSGLPTFTGVRVLPSLAPQSAAVRLFERAGLKLDFQGVHEYRIPYAAEFPAPVFIAEGAPSPVIQANLDALVVGPPAKMLFICGISGTLETYSIEAASGIITNIMTDSASKALDAAVFSDVPGDEIRPPGILHGVVAQTPVAGGGLTALVGDLKKLIGEIASAGLDTDDVVIITNPVNATSLRLLAPQPFAHSIFSTTALPVGTVVAVLPDGVATGYSGAPEINTSKQALVHFEDTAPAQIGSSGTPSVVAAPTLSAFQTDVLLLRLRTKVAWAPRSGAVQVVHSVTW